MSKVKIVTDCTADLPKKIVKDYDIAVVPLKVFIKGEPHVTTELSDAEFYELLPELDELPTTSQPSPKEFYSNYKELADEVEAIISIHISKKMSGTVASAKSAKKMLPDVDIRLYNSKNTSAGLGLIVLTAAKAAKEGKSVEEICQIVENAIKAVETIGFPVTLKYLEKGGRIGKAKGMLGRLLGRIPILKINKEGETTSVTTAKGKRNAVDWLINYLKEKKLDDSFIYSITHGNIESLAQLLQQRVKKELKVDIEYMNTLGPIIGTHLGPGSIFFAFVKKPEK
jgi:DegV family protein with EDD domain